MKWAQALESLMGLAAGHGHMRTRTGPKDAALREARVCYNHLVGRRGVVTFRAMRRAVHFSPAGQQAFDRLFPA